MTSLHRESNVTRVVVTAGASGIGLAIAKRFLRDGATVWVCDVDNSRLEETLSANHGINGKIANVGEPEDVERFFGEALSAMGGIDVLVNNAGIGGPAAPIEDIEYSSWDECMRVNLSSMFYCIKQVVSQMKQQSDGSIINIATASANTGIPNRLPYIASKVGVLGLTHNVARELGPYNVRCNAILPGLIDNPRGRMLVERLAESSDTSVADAENEVLKYISMRTWIHPSEVAEVATFLASDAGQHITAQEISVDGNCEWEQ